MFAFSVHVYSAPFHMNLYWVSNLFDFFPQPVTRFAGGEKRRSVGAIDGKDGSPPSSVSHFKPFFTLPPSLFYSDPSWKIEPFIIRHGRGGVCVLGRGHHLFIKLFHKNPFLLVMTSL